MLREGGEAMSERMFVIGLLIGVVSLVISVAACTTMEIMGYGYWGPTSMAVIVSVVLAAVAGFAYGTSCK
jgi:hypothetical protein